MKYLETMPWFAVPFDDSRTAQLKGLYAIDGLYLNIPANVRRNVKTRFQEILIDCFTKQY